MGQPLTLFVYFHSFQTKIYRKNLRFQLDSNSDCRSRGRARWPLDHHHCLMLFIVFKWIDDLEFTDLVLPVWEYFWKIKMIFGSFWFLNYLFLRWKLQKVLKDESGIEVKDEKIISSFLIVTKKCKRRNSKLSELTHSVTR